MNLKDYGEVEIQQDLNKLLIQVQKELKKKMFPRKHRQVLKREVEICIGDLGERSYFKKNTAGIYETIENKRHEYKFKHKITIDKWVYYEYKNGVCGLGKYKRDTKRALKDVIAHELIHAYVYENYEFCGYDYGYHSDGSPIFLSILTFLNISSGHKAMKSFKYTDIYKKVKSYDNFEKIEPYLIHLTCSYEKAFRELETLFLQNNISINSFYFSDGNITGTKGILTGVTKIEGSIGKVNSFSIGPNADINNLKEIVLSKINRNVFDKKYVITGCDKKDKLKLQTMNI